MIYNCKAILKNIRIFENYFRFTEVRIHENNFHKEYLGTYFDVRKYCFVKTYYVWKHSS